jgi:aminoglycoside phosphotransferase (APT) family kinase protein
MADEIRVSELTLIGEGREAEVFALDAERALRLARDERFETALAAEHDALVAAAAAGAPVPRVFERVSVEGRPGLVLERLGARNLLLEIGSQPWRVWTVGRELGRLHGRIHAAVAPESLESVHTRLRERLASALVPDRVRTAALQRLERLPTGDRLCHGDFHPGNVLRSAGGTGVVIDWTGASRGDPAADVARSFLIIRHGALTPDATRAVEVLARVGRRALWAAYASTYGRADVAAASSWLPVIAAARLAEDIAGERAQLLELAGRA